MNQQLQTLYELRDEFSKELVSQLMLEKQSSETLKLARKNLKLMNKDLIEILRAIDFLESKETNKA